MSLMVLQAVAPAPVILSIIASFRCILTSLYQCAAAHEAPESCKPATGHRTAAAGTFC